MKSWARSTPNSRPTVSSAIPRHDVTTLFFDQFNNVCSQLSAKELKNFVVPLAEESVNRRTFKAFLLVNNLDDLHMIKEMNGGSKIVWGGSDDATSFGWTRAELEGIVSKYVEAGYVSPSDPVLRERLEEAVIAERPEPLATYLDLYRWASADSSSRCRPFPASP